MGWRIWKHGFLRRSPPDKWAMVADGSCCRLVAVSWRAKSSVVQGETPECAHKPSQCFTHSSQASTPPLQKAEAPLSSHQYQAISGSKDYTRSSDRGSGSCYFAAGRVLRRWCQSLPKNNSPAGLRRRRQLPRNLPGELCRPFHLRLLGSGNDGGSLIGVSALLASIVYRRRDVVIRLPRTHRAVRIKRAGNTAGNLDIGSTRNRPAIDIVGNYIWRSASPPR